MEKHCEKCVKENIGCKEIQHLFRDVDKLKASKNFNTFLYIFIAVISVGFVIVSIIVWHNMLKQSISTADLKPEELKNMADLFNSQFSNLLTVLGILLTIFGVLTPIVNAIYQKQTLKDERESLRREIDVSLANLKEKEKNLEDKLELATEKIKRIDQKVKEINLTIAMSHEASIVLFGRNYHSAKNDIEKQIAVEGIIISCDHDLNCRVKNKEKHESVALLEKVLQFLTKVPCEIKVAVKSSIRRNAKPLDSFVSGKEIKELLGPKNIELYRKYREFFIDLYPWKFDGDGEPNEN